PESFAFTPENQAWAEAQITKYPEGRQASAIIPLLWRAQEQEGWLSRPAIEAVAAMLDMAYIRALEVATFYFMFQLQPVGAVAHIQVCGTTSCMICGAEDLIAVCREKIAPEPHALSEDGKLSWEEVECLGACANAPMAQIGKDYYEDLTAESFAAILDALRAGEVPRPGPQNGRYAAEPAGGLTSLEEFGKAPADGNASVGLALAIGDTVKRIDGTEVPLVAPWTGASGTISGDDEARAKADRDKGPSKATMEAGKTARPAQGSAAPAKAEDRPAALEQPRGDAADDLKRIKGVGPKLEKLLHTLGIFHFDQIAAWTETELAWIDDNLEGFKGRASRDEWVAQAKALAGEGAT
ncbi:MAG: NADH-quinone oxidoreductase subunit NuoE, partial [Paracoccaceae bacterium]|nr:NADH-quinone oxidoreductase subunit NuoE [Paracoccaceae bacterium]